ncbi:MAG: LPS assembly protein LptD [Planctomycetes bacterium]|nr:LPS assembly protein LptD [Planctomycetota bacterium]
MLTRTATRIAPALVLAALAAATALGQTAQPEPQGFAGVRFTQAPATGKLTFKALRANVWREGNTRRLLLSGDTRVRIAQYEFVAKRAAVWMEPVSAPNEPPVMQVFAVFDELGDPAQPSSIGFQANRLPVRAVIRVEGKVELSTDAITNTPPVASKDDPDAAFEAEAQAALAASLTRTTTPATAPPPLPTVISAAAAPAFGPARSEPLPAPPPGPIEQQATAKLAGQPRDVIFAKDGLITLGAKDLTVVSGEDENSVVASGGVILVYQDTRSNRTLQLTAERAVVFTDPGQLADMARFTIAQVRGVFLEGDVTGSDGKYTIRGPQIYYDVRANRAVMLDAVFWTYDEKRRLPLYVRAKTVRQTAADQFQAEHAEFTNSAFFEPELSIGASSVTITRKDVPAEAESPLDAAAAKRAPTQSTTLLQADDVTMRGVGVPFFYWPTYAGDASQPPIRDFRVENRNGSGVAIKATINAYSLLGLQKPADRTWELMTDVYFERGLGIGTRLGWNNESNKGGLFVYTLPYDVGTDVLKPGTKLEHDGDFRGIFTGEHRWRMDEKWSLFAEASYITDATFIDAFFENLGETRREFTNRLRADRVAGNSALSIESKGTFNDFISNEWLLQSQGYSVNKLGEASYARQADDLLKEAYPGLLSYWSEYRVGGMQMAFDEIQARKRGFTTDYLAQRAFGFNADQSYGDILRAQGLNESTVVRGDTRQELTLNAAAGPVKLTPFVVGRVTGYDNKFEAYSPDENDYARLWGSVGMRVSTEMQAVYDTADSRLFDIHRLRHVVQPNATIWYGGTTVDSSALPIYDESVESLTNGSMARVGATQILQTQRGGPGRWHSVDLLTVSTDFVFSSGEANSKSPIGRFFDYRPEYANPGNYFIGDLTYRVTDSLALTGATVYDFDLSQQAFGSAGVIIRQGPHFSISSDVRFINELDSTYWNMGATYELTNKYSVFAGAAYDLNAGGFQTSYVEVRRQFSAMLLGVSLGYNEITGETSFGFVFRPNGVVGEGRLTSGSSSNEFGS